VLPTKNDEIRANKIILTIQESEGKISLFDVLDKLKIPIYWWRTHKLWFFNRFAYVTTDEIDGLLYLVIDVPEKLPTEEKPQ